MCLHPLEKYGNSPYNRLNRIVPVSTHPQQPPAKRAPKTERIEVRVIPIVKETIRRATAVSGLAVGDLAYEGARRILENYERMVLRGADRDAFLRAVEKPPLPTKRLVAALRRHKQMIAK